MPSTETTLALEELNFWSLPEDKQKEIKASIPKLNTWELDCYRDESGYWFFDLEDYGVHAEAFINGTQKALDWHYAYVSQLIPDKHSKMKLTVSIRKQNPTDVPLFLKGEDPLYKGAHNYFDPVSGKNIWLCPFVQILFGYAPELLYIHFQPYL